MSIPKLKSVEKAFCLLETLNKSPFSSTAALTRKVGMPRASVQRLLVTLESLGYVKRDQTSKRYSLSDRVLNLSVGYGYSNLIADLGTPLIRALSEHLLWPVVLTYPQGLKVDVISTTQKDSPVAIQRLNAGHSIPLIESATSRVFLAVASDEVRTHYLSAMRKSGLPPAQLKTLRSEVRMAAQQGFFIYRKTSDPEKALAVPIVVDGSFCAGLVVRFIGSALPEHEAVQNLVPHLKYTAGKISEEIGKRHISKPQTVHHVK